MALIRAQCPEVMACGPLGWSHWFVVPWLVLSPFGALELGEDSLAEASRNQIRYKGMWGPVVVGERIRAGDLIMSAGIFRASTCHRE